MSVGGAQEHRKAHLMKLFNRLIATCLAALIALFVLREIDHHQERRSHSKPIAVYVTGEVAVPGAITLPNGARVIHAIERCGGVTGKADLAEVGMARLLEDGETVNVRAKSTPPSSPPPLSTSSQPQRSSALSSTAHQPSQSSPNKGADPSAPTPTPVARSGRVNINTATFSDLEQLPGIGPVLAERIINERESRPGGTFTSLEDLTTVRGIKGKTMVRLQPHLELEGK